MFFSLYDATTVSNVDEIFRNDTVSFDWITLWAFTYSPTVSESHTIHLFMRAICVFSILNVMMAGDDFVSDPRCKAFVSFVTNDNCGTSTGAEKSRATWLRIVIETKVHTRL